MKVKKVNVKKLCKLLERNNELLEQLIKAFNEEKKPDKVDVDTMDSPIEVVTEDEPIKKPNGVTLTKENWKEYLNLMTSNFTVSEDGQTYIDIFLDTSGSMNEELLRKFLLACKDMVQYHNVRVGCFDLECFGLYPVNDEEDLKNFKFEGGTGTDFNVAIDAFDEKVPNRIIFTDGEANMPKDSKGAYWIVNSNMIIYPNNGQVIYLDENIILNDNSIQTTR